MSKRKRTAAFIESDSDDSDTGADFDEVGHRIFASIKPHLY